MTLKIQSTIPMRIVNSPRSWPYYCNRNQSLLNHTRNQWKSLIPGPRTIKKEIKIGVAVDVDVKKGLIELLRKYVDVFAWSYQDMYGLDTNIMVHRLSVKEECLLVKQKLRRTRPNMTTKIKEEVQKQFDTGFLAVSNYP